MITVVKNAFSKLRKMFKKGYEYYLTIYLIVNVTWIFLGMFLCNYIRYSYHTFSSSYVLFLILNILTITLLNFLRKIKFNKIDIFLILLVLFGIIATIFAHDISISLYGWWKRYEGLVQLLYYYSMMYLSTTIFKDKYKKWIIRFILAFGLINVFACILQVFNILKFIPIAGRGIQLGQGLTGNSNFFGSYMVLCLGISIGLFLYNDNKKNNIICMFLYILFYSGLLLSSALSAMVGFFFIGLYVFIYFIFLLKKKQVNKYLIIKHIVLIVSLVCVNTILNNNNKTVMNKDVSRLTKETREIFNGNIKDSYGSSRMFIWKNTIKIVPNYLLHGVGIDNFYNAFGDKPLLIDHGTYVEFFDKAHNEYLQKLVCEGLFSCLTYIGMLFVIFINSIKRIFMEKNYIIIGLFLSFVGYAIQAFFNISVIEVAPLFWIVCGLLYERNYKIKRKSHKIS